MISELLAVNQDALVRVATDYSKSASLFFNEGDNRLHQELLAIFGRDRLPTLPRADNSLSSTNATDYN